MIDVNLDFPNVFDANEPVPLLPAPVIHANGNPENIADPAENGVNGDDSDEGNETDDSEQAITEFWLSPEDPAAVDIIYSHMNRYPIEREIDSDEDMNGGSSDEFYDGNDGGDDVGQANLANMEINGKLLTLKHQNLKIY